MELSGVEDTLGQLAEGGWELILAAAAVALLLDLLRPIDLSLFMAAQALHSAQGKT